MKILISIKRNLKIFSNIFTYNLTLYRLLIFLKINIFWRDVLIKIKIFGTHLRSKVYFFFIDNVFFISLIKLVIF